jgi:hypothetical protein
MSKKIAFSTKPSAKPAAPNPNEWVENRAAEGVKRLTLDLPATLHAHIKSTCALQGIHMRDEIHKLLEQHFSNPKP